MKNLVFAFLLLCVTGPSYGQDLTGLIEKSPTFSMILVRTLERGPAFSAKVQVTAVSKSDPVPNVASGTFEFTNGNLRWEANLQDISSGQLTTQTRSAVRQINGDHFLLLTRSDKMANYFILTKAQACLEEQLPGVKLFSSKATVGKDLIDGRNCRREKMVGRLADGTTNEVLVWTPLDPKSPPLQIQITDQTDVFRIRFSEIQMHSTPVSRFQVPEGLSMYSSIEDLIQSVLLDRLKRRMGIERKSG